MYKQILIFFNKIDGVFSFCSDVTDGTELWQECVEHYCPCNGDIVEPPRNKIYF